MCYVSVTGLTNSLQKFLQPRALFTWRNCYMFLIGHYFALLYSTGCHFAPFPSLAVPMRSNGYGGPFGGLYIPAQTQ